MVSFLDTYPRQLDDRNRFVLPSKIRDMLGETVTIMCSLVADCLVLYPQEEWERISAKIRELPTVTDANAAEFQRVLCGSAATSEVDKQGRISLKDDHIQFAGLVKDIVLVGTNAKIEIWDKTAYEEKCRSYNRDIILRGLEKYGFSI